MPLRPTDVSRLTETVSHCDSRWRCSQPAAAAACLASSFPFQTSIVPRCTSVLCTIRVRSTEAH